MGDRSLQKTSSPNAPRHTGILLSHLLDLHLDLLDLHHDAGIAPMTPITLSSVTYTHADLTFIVHNGVRSCACCGYLLEMRYVDLSSNCAL
jgi:hypothetical protein